VDSAAAGLRVHVRVRPGASRTSVGGRYGDESLVVAVNARPVDGQANRAVVLAVAAAFEVRRSAVMVLSGHASRDKSVFIAGDAAALRERLRALRDH
jgi:uncharacterized protein (TIGR00251 family)